MSVSFLQAATSFADTASYTFSSQNLGAAAADRHIIVCIGSRKAGGDTSISSITVGGVAATAVVTVQSGTTNRSISSIYIAAVPTGTTGDVVVTFADSMLRCGISLYRAVSLASATAHDTDTDVNNDPVGSIDVPAGGFCIGNGWTGQNTSAVWTGLTENADTAVSGEAGTITTASDTFASAQTALAITCDFGAFSDSAGTFASFGPATSGGGNLLLLGVG